MFFFNYNNTEKYAKGGKLSSKYNYIRNADIESAEVNKKGKTIEIDGADIIDGLYVKKGKYANGGEIYDWEGVDVDLLISLEEYGFVAKKVTKDYEDEYQIVYKIEPNSYGVAYLRESFLDDLIGGKEWASEDDINSFIDSVGSTKDEWFKLSFVSKLLDTLSYWGYLSILGTDYDPNNKEWAYKFIGIEDDGFYKSGGATRSQKNKIRKVMREFKEGTLHSGKSNIIVKDREQAIAIALSEAGLSKKAEGGKVKSDIPKNAEYHDIVDIYNKLVLPKDVYLNNEKYIGEASIVNGYNGYESSPQDGLLGVFKEVPKGRNVWMGFVGYLQDENGKYLRAKQRRGQVIDIATEKTFAKGGEIKPMRNNIKQLLAQKGYAPIIDSIDKSFSELKRAGYTTADIKDTLYDIYGNDDEKINQYISNKYASGGEVGDSKIYKLRAEGLDDFLAFLRTGMYVKIESFTVEPIGIPDVVVTFKTSSPLSEIKSKLKEVPDSHVMLQTVKPINEYTGEREEKYASGGGVLYTNEKNPISYLKKMGAKIESDLNYSTEYSGINYYVGRKGNTAIVVAFIDDDNYIIAKEDAREMATTAKTKGVENVELYTNYGIELHSKNEKPQTIGFDKIYKVVSDSFANGGEVNENAHMIMNQNHQIKHHTEELENIVTENTHVPAWVVAKISDAANDLSDATHYLDGEKEIKKDEILPYEKGGSVSLHLDELYKRHNNSVDAAMEDYAGELGIFNIYYGHKVDPLKKAKWKSGYDYLNKKHEANRNKKADGGSVDENRYNGKKMADVWNEWSEKQRQHFLYDHLLLTGDNMIRISRYRFEELPEQELNRVIEELEKHIKSVSYESGGKVNKANMYTIRKDLIEDEMGVTVGSDYVYGGVYEGRYVNEDNFQIYHNNEWKDAESIDWEMAK